MRSWAPTSSDSVGYVYARPDELLERFLGVLSASVANEHGILGNQGITVAARGRAIWWRPLCATVSMLGWRIQHQRSADRMTVQVSYRNAAVSTQGVQYKETATACTYRHR